VLTAAGRDGGSIAKSAEPSPNADVLLNPRIFETTSGIRVVDRSGEVPGAARLNFETWFAAHGEDLRRR
jgi:hypothetical protein